MTKADLSKCPFCGVAANPRTSIESVGYVHWDCGSFELGPERHQSADCKLSIAAQRITELEAEVADQAAKARLARAKAERMAADVQVHG